MSSFENISISGTAKYNSGSKTIKDNMEFVHKKLLDDTVNYNNEIELIEYTRWPFADIYDILTLTSFKEKNGMVHLYAELYCTATNYHGNTLYQMIPGGELEKGLRPTSIVFLNILATDIAYCNVCPGFMFMQPSGELKYSLQDPIQRYIFINGSWNTTSPVTYLQEEES